MTAILGAMAGGIIGALTQVGVPDEHVVMVKADAARAQTAMGNHHPVDLEQRAAYWQERGWERYDPDAPAYTRDEIARERPALPGSKHDRRP